MPGPYLIDVNSAAEVETALKKAISRPENLMGEVRQLCKELHSFNDGHSSERVLDAVDDFLSSQQSRLRKKPLNLIRKFKVRKRLNRLLRA